MKKLTMLILAAAVSLIILSGCQKETQSAVEITQEPQQTASVPEPEGIYVENAFLYSHINGHKEVTEKTAFVLFEYELLDKVKYQVAYIACTCRGPEVNYWSVAYVELSKEDGSLVSISWDEDNTGHYTAGMYGDSEVTWEGAPVHDLLDYYVSDQLLGKPQEYVNSIEPMHGDLSGKGDTEEDADDHSGASEEGSDSHSGASEAVVDTDRAVDDYTGATVTPNNVTRMLQGLFTYHNERYM
ncbi:MAG: hypothetical protein PQJ47_04165 [Sphaerochaetaceae bacterium]|nr:hypothetical protein [Sphaerochaetaceae bacterium]